MSKVLVSLPDPLLKRVGRFTKSRKCSRSSLVQEALEEWLRARDYVPPKDRSGVMEAMRLMEEARNKYREPKGGLVKELRKMRESN